MGMEIMPGPVAAGIRLTNEQVFYVAGAVLILVLGLMSMWHRRGWHRGYDEADSEYNYYDEDD
jgi:hypothetical protein